jgi:hypothetical protein
MLENEPLRSHYKTNLKPGKQGEKQYIPQEGSTGKRWEKFVTSKGLQYWS